MADPYFLRTADGDARRRSATAALDLGTWLWRLRESDTPVPPSVREAVSAWALATEGYLGTVEPQLCRTTTDALLHLTAAGAATLCGQATTAEGPPLPTGAEALLHPLCPTCRGAAGGPPPPRGEGQHHDTSPPQPHRGTAPHTTAEGHHSDGTTEGQHHDAGEEK